MGNSYSLDAVVKIIAYGVPALLILLDFFAAVGGYTIEAVSGNVGMKNFGIGLIVIGVLIYLLEIAIAVYIEYS